VAQSVAEPPPKVAASVRRIFGSGASATQVAIDTNRAYRITRGDSLQGFAVVREVKGKDQPITFLVAIDTADRLRDVDILVYREPYGGEVAYDAWRRQFRGKSSDAALQVGRDIRTISGATISVNAVTLGVRKALHDLTDWHRSGALK
jgi:Na+-translocating ferredoxin:NAD+ oxidoreductase RnfG subunit